MTNKRFISPEVFLYDAINETSRRRRSQGFDPTDVMTAITVKYALGDKDLYDEARNGVRLYYPRGCVRAFIPGLDVNIPFKKCRVFFPADSDIGKLTIDVGQPIFVRFTDKTTLGSGIWDGKRTDYKKEEIETFAKKILQNGAVGYEDVPEGATRSTPPPVGSQEDAGETLSTTLMLTYPISEESLRRAGADKFVTGQFGEQRPTHIHAGVDLRTKHPISPADPIEIIFVAASGGTILHVSPDWETNPDANIVIEHVNQKTSVKFVTRYFHMKDPMVKIGEYVLAGAPIAKGRYYVYNGTANPHLHFEVVKGWGTPERKAINPLRNSIAIISL